MDKQIIMRNFSRCAPVYDRHTDVQKKAAKELLKYIRLPKLVKILEIGCGTGHLTLLLKKKYKKAHLRAVDISSRMVEVAREKLKDASTEFIVCDAERMAGDNEFDLIASNACFQWFDDLRSALLRYKKSLKPGGEIVFSFYGPQTFWELNACLKNVNKAFVLTAKNFISERALKEFLKQNFSNAVLEKKIYCEKLPSLFGLLKKIKYSGVRGYSSGSFSFSSRLLKDVEADYLKRFGCIQATHQIFFCRGVK